MNVKGLGQKPSGRNSQAVSPLLCLRLQTGCSARRPIGQPRQLDRAGTVAPLTRAAER